MFENKQGYLVYVPTKIIFIAQRNRKNYETDYHFPSRLEPIGNIFFKKMKNWKKNLNLSGDQKM